MNRIVRISPKVDDVHFAIEVRDIGNATREIASCGSEIVSDPGVIPVKFRASGGTIAELVPVGRYKR